MTSKHIKSDENKLPEEVFYITRLLAKIAVEDFFQERSKKK